MVRLFMTGARPWVMTAIVGASLMAGSAAQAGSVTSGLGSGVTVSGSAPLSLGASSLDGGRALRQLLMDIERRTFVTLAIDDGPAVAQGSPRQTADNTAPAIAASSRATVVAAAGRLVIGAPVPSLAGGDQVISIATYTPSQGRGTTVTVPLIGSLEQVANGAAFLAAAAAAGISPERVSFYTDLALAGVDYVSVVDLLNSLVGLAVPEELEEIELARLNLIIAVYNQILDNSSLAVLQQLDQNPDFLALGQALNSLRASVASNME